MLLSELLQQNQIQSATHSDIYCSDMISAEDTQHIAPEASTYLVAPSKAEPLYTFRNSEDFSFQQNSLWTTYTPSNAPKQSPFTYYTQYYYQQYDNYVDHILKGYIQYGEISDSPRISQVFPFYFLTISAALFSLAFHPTAHRRKTYQSEKIYQTNPKYYAIKISGHGGNEETPIFDVPSLTCFFFFRQKISQLEYQIKEFENEKRYGTRDMDSIEEDINALRRDITSIRRNELNMFYYF